MKGVDNRPAFLSVPRDVQLQNLPYDYTPVNSVESPRILDTAAAAETPDLLAHATRITILAGNGAVWSDAGDEIAAFASEYQVPVVTTLRGKGAIPEDHPLAMGVFARRQPVVEPSGDGIGHGRHRFGTVDRARGHPERTQHARMDGCLRAQQGPGARRHQPEQRDRQGIPATVHDG